MRAELAKTRLVKALTDMRITVGCLICLLIIVLVGTLYQTAVWRDLATLSESPESKIPLFITTSRIWHAVFTGEWGLYASQQKFFNSWFVFFGGIPVFPGCRLVMWVFFANLVATMSFRLRYTWPRVGITTLHSGLLLFFLNAFLTFHLAENSLLAMYERESSTVSWDAGEWELAVMKVEDDGTRVKRDTWALDTVNLSAGDTMVVAEAGAQVEIAAYYPHAEPKGTMRLITSFEALTPVSQYERNEPGVELTVVVDGGEPQLVRLWGPLMKPMPIEGKDDWVVTLQRKRFELPFELRLLDVSQGLHQGTQIASSYQSTVEVIRNGSTREIDITMNHPLRHDAYTVFQQGYQMDQNGFELSTFAVVRNPARQLPLIACIVTCMGLLIHFSLSFFKHLKRRHKEGAL